MATETEAEAGARRTRRKSRSSTRRADVSLRLGDLRRLWRAHLLRTMTVLTVAWVGYVYVSTYQDTSVYDAVGAGMTQQDTLYVLGEPATRLAEPDRERWVYRRGNQVLTVDFDPSGRMVNVLCASRSRSPGDCNAAHRVTLAMSEDQVWYLLGAPSIAFLDGKIKVIGYPDIGLTLRLEQFQVAAISRQPRSDAIGIIPRAARIAVP